MKTLVASLLFSIGTLFLITAVNVPLDNKIDRDRQWQQITVDALIGLSMTGMGGWMAWNLYRKGQQKSQDRLQDVLSELIEANNGYVTVPQLASKAHLTEKAAEKYLEARAKESSAIFEVVTTGEIVYTFKVDRKGWMSKN